MQPGRGTLLLELSPPFPWPPQQAILLGERIHTPDFAIGICALPIAGLEITCSMLGESAHVITTCPIAFSGEGKFRLAIAWEGWSIVVYAGGECIASEGRPTISVDHVEILLVPELPPLPADIPAPSLYQKLRSN
jgi:hypothetical protein